MIEQTILLITAGIEIGLVIGAMAFRENKRFRCRRGCCVNKPVGGKR